MSAAGYIRYDARGAMLDYSGMSHWAEFAARRLKDWTWACGRPPADSAADLARIAGVRRVAWKRVEQELLARGWRHKDSLFVHPPTLRLLREACAARRKFLAAARRAARARWHRPSAIPDDKSSMSNPQLPPDADGMPPACAPHADGNAAAMPLKGKGKDKVPLPYLERLSTERLSVQRSDPLTRKAGASSAEDNGLGARSPENLFLDEVRGLCDSIRASSGRAELQNWGGWWRLRFRESPEKCRTVLADIGSMAREGRLKGAFGPACFDLWKRLP